MKNSFASVVGLALVSLWGVSAGASVVCSGATSYYSAIVRTFGTQPRPGTEKGRTVIVVDGEVLQDEKFYSGVGRAEVSKFLVDVKSPGVEVDREGRAVFGSRIFKTRMIVYRLDDQDPQRKTDVLVDESVVCRESWSMPQ